MAAAVGKMPNCSNSYCAIPGQKLSPSTASLRGPLTSSMTTQICLTHSIIDWVVPAMVMARSVELGSMSPATCTWAPVDWRVEEEKKKTVVLKSNEFGPSANNEFCLKKCQQKRLFQDFSFQGTSLISLILQPPLPIREPHWLAGTTMRRVTGGLLVAVLFVIELLMSWTRMWGKIAVIFHVHQGQQPIISLPGVTNLFQLVNDHGERFKDGSGRTCQSDDPLGAVALGDVDASAALKTGKWAKDLEMRFRLGKKNRT